MGNFNGAFGVLFHCHVEDGPACSELVRLCVLLRVSGDTPHLCPALFFRMTMCQMNVGYRITIGEDMYGGGAGLWFDIWNTDGITPPPFSRTPAPPQHPPVSPEKPGQLLQDFVIAKESAGIGGFRVEIIKMHPPPPARTPPPRQTLSNHRPQGWVGLGWRPHAGTGPRVGASFPAPPRG